MRLLGRRLRLPMALLAVIVRPLVVCPEERTVFFHVPKAAGFSLGGLLMTERVADGTPDAGPWYSKASSIPRAYLGGRTLGVSVTSRKVVPYVVGLHTLQVVEALVKLGADADQRQPLSLSARARGGTWSTCTWST